MVKIEFYSFWSSFYTHSTYPYFYKYFENIFKDLGYETVQVYSVFGQAPCKLNVNPKILTVQWSGESIYNDTSLYNINLIAKKSINNIIGSVLAATVVYSRDTVHKLTLPRPPPNKSRFCNFIVSNDRALERKNFFIELSKYKSVDSCGRLFKNWKGPDPPEFDSPEYHQFLSPWKFMICFENWSNDYYLTEKLINAYLGGCIPIYWGCPQIKQICNEKAVLVLDSNTPEAIQKLIDRIIELDNNEELYLEMYNQPLFKDNKLAKEFTIEYIRESVKIINKELRA